MRYEVPIVYRGQSNYIVEAVSKADAKKKARTCFNNGHKPDELGNEWEEIERIGEITEVLSDLRSQP